MSWISERNNEGYWNSESERKYFNDFWDAPANKKWADEHDEDFLFYLSMLKDARAKEVEKYPKAVYNRKPYSETMRELNPVPKSKASKPVSKADELRMAREDADAIIARARAKKAAAEKPKELSWDERMRKFQKEDGNMEVAEFAFKGLPVYLVSEPMKGFEDGDRAVLNAGGTEILGRLGDPKFKTLFEKVKKSEEESSEEEPPPPPPDDDMPPPPPTPRASSAMSRECPKTPRQPNSSVRRTKTPMRGPNPKRPGWKLPRKPYGHAREVVELEDDLTDAELKKMTSELPRRCLVDAVLDWAKDNEKIVLPSITRADKSEIVATIKEHRIPVPKMSGGGYYGEDDDVSCLFGDGDQKCVEINLSGGADPAPRDDPMGEDTEEEEDEEEESEDDFARDIAFVCAECGQDVMWGSPEYAGRRDTEQGQICADCAELLGIESEEEQEADYETDSGPEGADTPRRARSPDMEGGSIPIDKALYEKAKAEVYPKYKKPSAYRSGALIKRYKELGGKFKEQGERKLGRWFKEDWKDVGNKDYPVYRPTKRITKDTPLTPKEIDPENMKLRIAEKQKIKGTKNLSPFFHLRGAASQYDWGGDEDVYYDADGKEVSKDEYEKEVSDGSEEDLPQQPQFVGDPSQFKIMPFDPNNPMMYMGSGNKADFLAQAKAFAKKAGYKDWNKIKYANDGVHKLELNGVKFGRKGYGDFIEYGMKDGAKEAQKHRKAYLARATKMPGNWKGDKMSKNNLAIKVLWGGAKQPALPPNVELVSKAENPVVEEIIEEPMDDGDIRAYYPNAKIIKYSDLKNYKTIQQLLPKDKSYVFLLYQHAPNNGHWVLLMRYGKTIEFFCSYGSQIDGPLKWTNPRDRQMLGEAVPYLTNLLKAQTEFNAIHNPVQYQSKGSDKATCGAHDVMRLSQMLNHGQDLTDYFDYMSRIKKESGLSYDEIVANFVSQR